jgi:hypothetical protein
MLVIGCKQYMPLQKRHYMATLKFNTWKQQSWKCGTNPIGMVCFVEGVLVEAKKWWQPCLGIEYACS